MTDATPVVAYWHVWVDRGVSRQARCRIERFGLKTIPGASPQWWDDLGTSRAGVSMIVLPVGWVGEWHENPKPQWIVPLSGRWFVETMDGERAEMGPGEISFGEDQGCVPDALGHKGHRSGTVGNEPAVLLLVQIEDGIAPSGPCRFA